MRFLILAVLLPQPASGFHLAVGTPFPPLAATTPRVTQFARLAQPTRRPNAPAMCEPPEPKRDLFIPILVGVSFGGYALIILYDVFFGRGLCGITVECSNSFW